MQVEGGIVKDIAGIVPVPKVHAYNGRDQRQPQRVRGEAMTTHAPLPLDAAARNLLHYINVMPDADTLLTPEVLLAETQLRAALSQPDTLAARVAELERELNGVREATATELRAAYKRVAELEAELKQSRHAHEKCMADNDALKAHANALRDALEEVLPGLSFSQQSRLRSLLDDTPAASLAAYRARVLEPYIAALSAWRAVETAEGTDCSEYEMSALRAEAHTLTTRALAAQAQEVKK